VVAANRQPDHDSICEFRKRHLKAHRPLFQAPLFSFSYSRSSSPCV
jgi:hypothetical protein